MIRRGQRSISVVAVVIGIILLRGVDVVQSNSNLQQLNWMIGQVISTDEPITTGNQMVDFWSTGFVFKSGEKLRFITTAHTLRKAIKEKGEDVQLYVGLSNLPQNMDSVYPIQHEFTVLQEDAAVFRIGRLEIERDYEQPYASALSLSEGASLISTGYPEYAMTGSPTVLSHTLLACAVLKNGRYDIGCDNVGPQDYVNLFSTGDITSAGLSGSPVLDANSGDLVGILTAIGTDKGDPRVTQMLGVSRFNIFKPLDTTIQKLLALPQ